MSLYAIYDPNKGKYIPHYNSRVPALYSSRTIAQEILERGRKNEVLPWDARVVSVELKAK